jgi:metal-responsive CopG/Arc/MetJ family transcriptional regulator
MKEPMQEVRLWIPYSLLDIIDNAVAKGGTDRAEFIREAILEKMDKESRYLKRQLITCRKSSPADRPYV